MAFRELVDRLGPMVLGVCRRVTRDTHLADDAFQAAFLVLARRAAEVPAESVRGWIYGVAVRTAREALAVMTRRRGREVPVAAVPDQSADMPEEPDSDALRLLDEEIAGLAEHLRVAVVMCELEGASRKEAADRLGIPEGTVRSRLAKARKVLAARLRRRGAVVSAAAFAALAPRAAAVPTRLADETAATALNSAAVPPAVATLAHGVFRMMLYQKLKMVVVTGALVVALAFGAGLAARDGRIAAATATAAAPAKDGGAEVAATVAKFVERLKNQQPPPRKLKKGDLGLFVMDIERGEATLIASEVEENRAYCGSASWSGNGRQIYFDASRGFGNFGDTQLQVLELTDTGTRLSSLGKGNWPAASPDGRLFAYVHQGPGWSVRVNREDTVVLELFNQGGFLKWSPDSKQLLIVSNSNPCELSVVNIATGSMKPVQLKDHRIYSVPSWVDGQTIVAFVRSPKGFSVALVDVGKPEEAKVKETLWKRGDGTNIEPMYPVYSLSQKRGAFVGRDPKGQALYSFEPGKAPRRLEPKRPLDPKIASPALSPDGRYLLFSADRVE